MMNTQVIKQAIENLTGRTVKELKFMEDPKVHNAWAIRTTYSDPGSSDTSWDPHHDFLLNLSGVSFKARLVDPVFVEGHLMETEFTSWPPVPGQMNFSVSLWYKMDSC